MVPARLAVKVNSEIGRTEYLLVGLGRDRRRRNGTSLAAYPMGQGSGSVTTFSRADGFATIGRHEEIVQAGTIISVQLLGRELQLADLVVIGSHCIALDYLLGELQRQGVRSKFLAVGSTGGIGCRQARRMRYRGRPPAGSEDQRIQSAVPHSGARAHSRLRPPAGHRLPPWRRALRRPDGAGCHRERHRRSRVRDGQSQSGERHARADRSAARRRQSRTAMPCSREITMPWQPPWCKAAPTGE